MATDFGQENGHATLTESGYPYIVKSLKRGQTLAQATEVYRGDIGDGGYGVSPSVYRDKQGTVTAVLLQRPLDTFRAETWRLIDGRPVRLQIPERVTIHGILDGALVFTLDEPWNGSIKSFAAGTLVAPPLDGLDKPNPHLVFGNMQVEVLAPTARQSVADVAVLDDRLVVALNDNVRGRLIALQSGGERPFHQAELNVPENSAVSLGDSSKSRGEVFVSSQGFLSPPSLSLLSLGARTPGRIAQPTLTELRTAPAKFDASTHITEQFEATSSDGTKIPYFVTRPRNQSGPAPTILFGYGGFQVSFPPAYKPEMGKLWLENGGVFVQANIRGGGEFGPQWHQSVLNENRQLAFDDFAAVAADLHRRGISSPRRTGIYGRSNGGVLTSVTMTQHPELINAAVIESPLIDMLRYHELPAGASWIGEYGDPRIPEEAAWIARYSAYQQLRPGAEYPRVYITTNTRDDRVHPGHARKFAARLGDLGYDHLYYEETAGGHSNDADPVANARRWARHYVYLAQQLMD